MTFKKALKLMNRGERFRATVYAMNTLLLQKGIYSAQDFEKLACEHFSLGFKGKKARCP